MLPHSKTKRFFLNLPLASCWERWFRFKILYMQSMRVQCWTLSSVVVGTQEKQYLLLQKVLGACVLHLTRSAIACWIFTGNLPSLTSPSLCLIQVCLSGRAHTDCKAWERAVGVVISCRVGGLAGGWLHPSLFPVSVVVSSRTHLLQPCPSIPPLLIRYVVSPLGACLLYTSLLLCLIPQFHASFSHVQFIFLFLYLHLSAHFLQLLQLSLAQSLLSFPMVAFKTQCCSLQPAEIHLC